MNLNVIPHVIRLKVSRHIVHPSVPYTTASSLRVMVRGPPPRSRLLGS